MAKISLKRLRRAGIVAHGGTTSCAIPSARRWLVNYWRDGRVIRSLKVDAPTKFLAKLVLHETYGWAPIDWERVTITPMKKVRP